MIILTKLNGVRFLLNDEKIETIHANPDTTIQLDNGIIYIVKESMEEIVDLIVAFRLKYSNEVFHGRDVSQRKDELEQ